MKVAFANEISHDAGGLSREFFTMLMKDIFSPKHRLFEQAATKDFSYKINEESMYQEDFHTIFYFIGKVLGKALFDHIPLNVCLNKSIYKAILK